MALKTLAVLIIAAICIMQVLCLPSPDVTQELSRAEATMNNTLESWKKGFESLFQDSAQLGTILDNIGTQLQSLSENIGNITENLKDSVSSTPVPSES